MNTRKGFRASSSASTGRKAVETTGTELLDGVAQVVEAHGVHAEGGEDASGACELVG